MCSGNWRVPPPRWEMLQAVGRISISEHDSSLCLSGESVIWSTSQKGRGPRWIFLMGEPWCLGPPGAARAGMPRASRQRVEGIILGAGMKEGTRLSSDKTTWLNTVISKLQSLWFLSACRGDRVGKVSDNHHVGTAQTIGLKQPPSDVVCGRSGNLDKGPARQLTRSAARTWGIAPTCIRLSGRRTSFASRRLYPRMERDAACLETLLSLGPAYRHGGDYSGLPVILPPSIYVRQPGPEGEMHPCQKCSPRDRHIGLMRYDEHWVMIRVSTVRVFSALTHLRPYFALLISSSISSTFLRNTLALSTSVSSTLPNLTHPSIAMRAYFTALTISLSRKYSSASVS